MVQTQPISKTILSLEDLEARFKLRPTEDEQFFVEWDQDLPLLDNEEKNTSAQIRNRFLRHRKRGVLVEGTI
jgi:hypothetical protein